MSQNIFKCKQTEKTVGVMVDGFIFATSDFCTEDNFTNTTIISVTADVLQEKIEEIS